MSLLQGKGAPQSGDGKESNVLPPLLDEKPYPRFTQPQKLTSSVGGGLGKRFSMIEELRKRGLVTYAPGTGGGLGRVLEKGLATGQSAEGSGKELSDGKHVGALGSGSHSKSSKLLRQGIELPALRLEAKGMIMKPFEGPKMAVELNDLAEISKYYQAGGWQQFSKAAITKFLVGDAFSEAGNNSEGSDSEESDEISGPDDGEAGKQTDDGGGIVMPASFSRLRDGAKSALARLETMEEDEQEEAVLGGMTLGMNKLMNYKRTPLKLRLSALKTNPDLARKFENKVLRDKSERRRLGRRNVPQTHVAKETDEDLPNVGSGSNVLVQFKTHMVADFVDGNIRRITDMGSTRALIERRRRQEREETKRILIKHRAEERESARLAKRLERIKKNEVKDQLKSAVQEMLVQQDIVNGYTSMFTKWFALTARTDVLANKLKRSREARKNLMRGIMAIISLQRTFRHRHMRKSVLQQSKTIAFLKRVSWKFRFDLRIKRKTRACDKIVLFVKEVNKSAAVLTTIRRFKWKIKRCQRCIKEYLSITASRIALLLLQFNAADQRRVKKLETIWRSRIRDHKSLWSKKKTATERTTKKSAAALKMEKRRYNMMLDTLIAELPEELKNIQPVDDDIKVYLIRTVLDNLRRRFRTELTSHATVKKQQQEMKKVRHVVLKNFPQASRLDQDDPAVAWLIQDEVVFDPVLVPIVSTTEIEELVAKGVATMKERRTNIAKQQEMFDIGEAGRLALKLHAELGYAPEYSKLNQTLASKLTG